MPLLHAAADVVYMGNFRNSLQNRSGCRVKPRPCTSSYDQNLPKVVRASFNQFWQRTIYDETAMPGCQAGNGMNDNGMRCGQVDMKQQGAGPARFPAPAQSSCPSLRHLCPATCHVTMFDVYTFAQYLKRCKPRIHDTFLVLPV